MSEKIKIVHPQFDRAEEIEFDYKPSSDEEFKSFIENAPMKILFGLGFRKWDSMNNIIKDNQEKPVSKVVEIPAINLSDGATVPMSFDIGRGSAPTELLEEDEDVILFPAEWWDIIPDGFKCTGLSGQELIFEKGVTDNDRRFGCLGYGIRRKIEGTKTT